MYAWTEPRSIRSFDSSRDPAIPSGWRTYSHDIVSVPLGTSGFGFFSWSPAARRSMRQTSDEMDDEERQMGRLRRSEGGGAVRLKRKAPERVGGSRIQDGLVEKRMKQEAANAMEMDEKQFEQRYNHGGKGRNARNRLRKNDDSRWGHDCFDTNASAFLAAPPPSRQQTPAARKVHLGATIKDPACKGMSVARRDNEKVGSTIVVSASDKARQFLDSMRLTKTCHSTEGVKAAHDGEIKSGLDHANVQRILISPSASPSIVDEPLAFRHDERLPQSARLNRQIQRDIVTAPRPPPVFLGPLPPDLTRVELVSLLAPYDVADWAEVRQTEESGHSTQTMVLQVEMKEDEGKEAIDFDANAGALRCRNKPVKVLDVEKRKKELEKAAEQDKAGKAAGAASAQQYHFSTTSAAFHLRGGGITSDDSSTMSDDGAEHATPEHSVTTLASKLSRTTRLESHVPDDLFADNVDDEESASSRLLLSPTPFGQTSPCSEHLSFFSPSATPASPRYTPPSHWVHPERIKSPWAYLGEHDDSPYAKREKEIEREMDQEVRVCIVKRKEKLVRWRVETLDLTGESDKEDSDGMCINA
ncbi:hypothetical protein Rt10032_c21g6507 [Rhodotorula toruloides]|uniref:Uncharacterized protein n=1 Tax=Rhodotorula toruloides TaxID=5286 RepID=A0A511KQ44_RHOTO|nr:hypothetical protein Rt10032_c21g6507 [Rhodotorula toruloides]